MKKACVFVAARSSFMKFAGGCVGVQKGRNVACASVFLISSKVRTGVAAAATRERRRTAAATDSLRIILSDQVLVFIQNAQGPTTPRARCLPPPRRTDPLPGQRHRPEPGRPGADAHDRSGRSALLRGVGLAVADRR